MTDESATPRDHEPTEIEILIHRAYEAFNDRDIDRALALMHPDVEWPNGSEGGYVRGHDAAREYWTRQWRQMDPTVTPEWIAIAEDGRAVVTVRQVVCDLSGEIMSEGMVSHVYTIENGLIVRMEIRA